MVLYRLIGGVNESKVSSLLSRVDTVKKGMTQNFSRIKYKITYRLFYTSLFRSEVVLVLNKDFLLRLEWDGI